MVSFEPRTRLIAAAVAPSNSAALESDAAADFGTAGQQSHGGQEQLGLSGSGFADDAEAFLGLDRAATRRQPPRASRFDAQSE